MSGLKITGFLKTEEVSSSDWATWRVGVRKPKKAFMTSRRPCVSLGNMSFLMMPFAWTFGFPRVCPLINSALYLLFAFFSTAFSWEPFFFLLLLRPLLFLSKETRKHFCTGDFVSRHSFAAGVLVSKQRSFSSELHLVCVLLLLLFLLLGLVGSLVLVSDLFGLGFVYFLGYLCFTHCASCV